MSEVQVQLNHHELKQALEHDAEFFIQFFLGQELTHSVPAFHTDIFYMMTLADIVRLCIAIPRDHAKTTLAKLAAVWYFLFSDFRFIVYLSNTSTIAVAACVDIVNFIESDNFKAVFGPVTWYTKKDGMGEYKFELNGKTCMLRALGAQMQTRGINIDNKRPQLAIVDDLEDPEQINGEMPFKKLKKWFYGTFRKALDKFHHKIIQIGNLNQAMSLVHEHCESPFWTSRRYGCLLENGEPLWPEAWPIEKLQAEYQEYQDAGMADVWFAEMMNLPINISNGLIKAEEITYAPIVYPEEVEYGFITIDLALSNKTWAHKNVIAIHAWTGTHWQVVQYFGETGIDPVSLFYKIIPLCFKWRIAVVGIESVAYQGSLQYVFEHMCRTEMIEGIKFVPLYTQNKNKLQRIAPWAGMLKKGKYALTEGDYTITQELLMYDPTAKENKDDHIDACAYGVQMLKMYLPMIIQQLTIDDANLTSSVQSLYQIASL